MDTSRYQAQSIINAARLEAEKILEQAAQAAQTIIDGALQKEAEIERSTGRPKQSRRRNKLKTDLVKVPTLL